MAKKNAGTRPKVATSPGASPSAKLQDFLTAAGESAKPPTGGRTHPGVLPENRKK
jgi:hypothetical protein